MVAAFPPIGRPRRRHPSGQYSSGAAVGARAGRFVGVCLPGGWDRGPCGGARAPRGLASDAPHGARSHAAWVRIGATACRALPWNPAQRPWPPLFPPGMALIYGLVRSNGVSRADGRLPCGSYGAKPQVTIFEPAPDTSLRVSRPYQTVDLCHFAVKKWQRPCGTVTPALGLACNRGNLPDSKKPCGRIASPPPRPRVPRRGAAPGRRPARRVRGILRSRILRSGRRVRSRPCRGTCA